jgi:hypothetical protein
MEVPIHQLLDKVVDFIALQGRKGASWSAVQTKFALGNSSVKYIIKCLLKRTFKIKCKSDSNISEIVADDQVNDNILLIDNLCAPEADQHRSFGLNSLIDIPNDPAYSIIELLGQAAEKGLVINEIIKALNIKLLHPFIDRLVSMGIVVKRIVVPKKASTHEFTRTNILHLKRFALAPLDDTLLYELADDVLSSTCHHIALLLGERQLERIKVSDLTKELNVNNRIMQALRKKVLNNQIKNYFPITFQWVENVNAKGVNRSAWFVVVNSNQRSEIVQTNVSGEQCVENLLLYEQSITFLNSHPSGLAINDYRDAVGLSHKHAMR